MGKALLHRLAILGLMCIGIFSLSGLEPVFAAEPDLTGLWTGRTTCPLGAVDLEIEIKGKSAEFRHHGYGPDRQDPISFPVKLRFSSGWEGEWVYFADEEDSHKSWGSFNGLLSKNGDSIQVRDRTSLGACSQFAFTRSVDVPSPVAEGGQCPKTSREPTENEMRSAVEAAGNKDINLGVASSSLRIGDFTKVACEKAVGLSGYNCDYKAYIDYQVSDSTHQQLFDWLRQAHGATGQDALVGRFVCSDGRWSMLPLR
ncbi:hypothetical protein [Halopseudomonas pelagia]|uniref:hypothetical protein n=1 Tax=Halopseudomonas pelagia TaxID=553151 RepID=UPI0003B2E225|nr:hypothetical protein [Halopseudomonas pelagia]